MPVRIGSSRPGHLPDPRKAYEADASRAADRAFYKSPAWRSCREAVLAANPVCNECRRVPAEQVHHRLERRDRPDLAFTASNLEALCLPCHNGKRRKG